MSEAEVNIRYRTYPVLLLNRSLYVFLPLAGVFVFWSSFVMLFAVASNYLQYGPTSLFIMMEIIAFAVLISLALLSADDSVFLTREGISLPFFLMPRIGFRSERGWSDLMTVSFKPKSKGGLLKLYFKDGKEVEFDSRYFKPKDLEQMIVAIDVWAGGSDSFPALLEARAHLGGHTLSDGRSKNSYTQMWEEELSVRFGATNFIPLEPGHKLQDGRITLERQMAFGGLSAIYLVKDLENSTLVLKEAVIPKEADEELRRQSITMLEREAHYLSSLNHPGLARVYDYFVEDDRHYLLMEYVKGTDLRRFIKENGAITSREAIDWGRQIAEILAYLHEQDPPIIHRDISADNIILNENDSLSIIDFGAANSFLGTATCTLIGKQAYIPPEQLRGKPTVKSDLYAFGCTLFFLLTGKDPEPISVSDPSATKADTPKHLSDLVVSLTQLEQEKRPVSARQVADLLTAWKDK
ncbi:MAG: serine/threonine protein kinase [Candidatus Obscuribacterales bacterium]|nr:serine/threonine protein kinase [Candidatus Obscuribacterales bacterium]